MVKNPPVIRETWVQSLGWKGPLEEGMATHSSGFWPGECHGLYNPWCHKESDTTEWLSLSPLLEFSAEHFFKVSLQRRAIASVELNPRLTTSFTSYQLARMEKGIFPEEEDSVKGLSCCIWRWLSLNNTGRKPGGPANIYQYQSKYNELSQKDPELTEVKKIYKEPKVEVMWENWGLTLQLEQTAQEDVGKPM